jgi:hypothetical protein
VRQFTVEIDEMICKWLEHISEVTGDSVEKLIANGIYHQISVLEDGVFNVFCVHETGA